MNTPLRQSLTFTLAIASMVALSLPAKAGIINSGTVGNLSDNGVLVGTSMDPHNDTLELVNEVIAGTDITSPDFISYNDMFDPDLPLALAYLERFENGSGDPVGGILGAFNISDFIWYTNTPQVDGMGNPIEKNETFIFPDAPPMSQNVDLWIISAQDILNFNGLALKYDGDAGGDSAIQYVTAKSSTSSGFSAAAPSHHNGVDSHVWNAC